ncbi:MAG TPA: heterodisulfide reductase-related iron-sulfur binding cluster [candidate division Zixibacteria bacterium]|nr:heterodisulfide reductase-related iron-sulfur binding cluster [candidate division Zixibacteria bacterium]
MDHPPQRAGVSAAADFAVPEIDRCVHCGLCLNQCPTYRALRVEADSPRGRIHLVRAAAEGRIEPGERFRRHLDLCLLCRACETACPSGVPYGRIAEHARSLLGVPGGWRGKIMHLAFTQLLPYPKRVRAMAHILRAYQRSGVQALARRALRGRLKELDALMPRLPGRFFKAPSRLPAAGARRARVAMLDGCVMPLLFSEVHEATVRVLQRNGCELVFPAAQTCCGALNLHNGETQAAKRMARRNIDAFLQAGVDAVVVNAAGCGAAMKEYGYLLRDDPAWAEKAARFSGLVKDAAELLAALGLRGPLGRLDVTVTYQDPCHLAHAQRIRAEPRRLLEAIPGLQLIEMEGADRCCGSAGIYNLIHSEMSRRLASEKCRAVAATGAAAVVAPNPGCMLQLGYATAKWGPAVAVYHLMDLLDRAYAAAEDARRL